MEIEPSKNPRPTFLTVICIISFVGLGSTIFHNFISIIFGRIGPSYYDLVQNNLENSLSQINATNPQLAPFIERIFESVLKLIDVMPLFATISIVISVIELVGVILMWKLLKTGFYIYSALKIIWIFVPMVLIGVNFMSIVMAIGSLFAAALFITLYALNLKAMK